MGGVSRRELRFVPRPLRAFLTQAPEIHPLSLRFDDPDLEADYGRAYFEASLPYIRLAHLLGAALWILFWGFALVIVKSGQAADLVLRFGFGVPIALLGLVVTYRSGYPRYWRRELAVVLLLSAIVWSAQRLFVVTGRADWGYAGVILILAFTYVLSRLPFLEASIVGVLVIAIYQVSWSFADESLVDLFVADYFLLSIAFVGMAASYGLERGNRLLFLTEREVDQERRRADALLRNTLPGAVIDRLSDRADRPEAAFLADGLPAVSVLFADLVDFTERSASIAPDELIGLLDDVFRRFDALTAELGVEKIKTVGDAYMVVAGAPEPRSDHAVAAAEMGLRILDALAACAWPNGAAMQVRIGIASGPAIAGVIGRQKFAYDLWGDTVNLASRLESNGIPGRILVSDGTEELLRGRYRFDPPVWLDLKGKGRTRAHRLAGRLHPAS